MVNLKWWQTLVVVLVGAGVLVLSQVKPVKGTDASMPIALTGGALLLAARTRPLGKKKPPAPPG